MRTAARRPARGRRGDPAVSPPAIAVAITSILLSTPLRPTICAPRIVPSTGSKRSLAAIRVAPGVVGRVVEGMGVDRPEGSARRPEPPFVPADRRRHDVEDLHDCGPERRDRMRRSPGDVVGDPAPLAVGHIREGDERGRVRDGVGLLDRVADGVDVGVVRLVRLVDGDATARPQLEPGELGERGRRVGRRSPRRRGRREAPARRRG